METFIYAWIGIWIGVTVILCLLLLGQVIGDGFPMWSKADRSAKKLLRAVLSREQFGQLVRQGPGSFRAPGTTFLPVNIACHVFTSRP